MAIEWSDNFKIGNPTIDAQHQQLFELANQVSRATSKAALTLCSVRLYRYTREHFRSEEDLMRYGNYADAKAHIEQHNQLISRLNEICEHIGDDSYNKAELENFMNQWLLDHVIQSDSRLSTHLAS